MCTRSTSCSHLGQVVTGMPKLSRLKGPKRSGRVQSVHALTRPDLTFMASTTTPGEGISTPAAAESCPWTQALQSGSFGARLSLQMKVLKHLRAGNHAKVADYLQMTKRALPKQKLAQVIDPQIASSAIDLLKSRGYVNAICEDGKFRIWLPKEAA